MRALVTAVSFLIAAGTAFAQGERGKLLLTGGVSSIDGAAGGGLTPWAVIGSYATAGQIGATAHLTLARTGDYALTTYGAALGFRERFEVSLARQEFDTRSSLAPLGLDGLKLKQDILGAKVRVAGDAVLDSDTWVPQVALGVQFKEAKPGALGPTLEALGADDSGVDVYVSATKLLLAQSLLINGTLRATKANQNGLLGFGGVAGDSYELMPEVSVAYLVSRSVAVGAEYRVKPDNLNPNPALGNGLAEDDWADVFVAWAPSKRVSLTVAYVDLGKIAPGVTSSRQRGGYVSAQIAF